MKITTRVSQQLLTNDNHRQTKKYLTLGMTIGLGVKGLLSRQDK